MDFVLQIKLIHNMKSSIIKTFWDSLYRLLFISIMKNKVENSSNIISEMLKSSVEPSNSSVRLHENFVVLCQSDNESSMPKFLAHFIQNAMFCFMNQIIPTSASTQLSKDEFHKAKIGNLMTSCRQEIQQNNTYGSCAFGLCYVSQNRLYCFRSDGIQMFLIDQQYQNMLPLDSSTQYVNNKRPRVKNREKNYFSADMPKINVKYLYEPNGYLKKHIYFESFGLNSYRTSKSNLKVLIGCSEVFDLISPEFVFNYLKQNHKKSDCEKANDILQQAKQKQKTVFNDNLSLCCWRIGQLKTIQ